MFKQLISSLFKDKTSEAAFTTLLSDSPHVKMVVGLGNPGKNYAETRHNVGFEVVDALLRGTSSEFKREKKWMAEVAKLDGTLVVKPLTFMNESGKAVGALARFYAIPASQILVVTDDVTLDTGTIRFRLKGSHGGQNGLRSIIQHLGTSDFPRLKLGVGKCSGAQLTGHVLGKFPPFERETVENMLASASQAVHVCLSQGIEAAANQYNTTIKSPKKESE